jgi:hypothetical protein
MTESPMTSEAPTNLHDPSNLIDQLTTFLGDNQVALAKNLGMTIREVKRNGEATYILEFKAELSPSR